MTSQIYSYNETLFSALRQDGSCSANVHIYTHLVATISFLHRKEDHPHLSSTNFPQIQPSTMNFGSVPIPQNGPPPRMVPTVPLSHAQAQYMNPMHPAQAGYGIHPGAQYGVPPGGMGQAGYSGMGQPTMPGQQVNPPLSSSYYNQHPMGQGVPGTTPPGQSATGTAAPPPNTTAQEQPDHHRRHRRNSHRIRDILADLLVGTAFAGLAEHHHRKKHREATPENSVNPQQPPPPHAPHGAALGFLHPKGHFQPASLEDMIRHFVHGNKEKGIAPDGARTGYLHTGGHFIPAGMEHLIEEFKHTLLYGPEANGPGATHQRGRRPRRGRSSSYSGSESEY